MDYDFFLEDVKRPEKRDNSKRRDHGVEPKESGGSGRGIALI